MFEMITFDTEKREDGWYAKAIFDDIEHTDWYGPEETEQNALNLCGDEEGICDLCGQRNCPEINECMNVDD